MFLSKRKEVDQYKMELDGYRTQCNQLRKERELQNYERKMLIRQQKEKGKQKEMEYLNEKRILALREKANMKNIHREEIYSYEQEAEELEKLEADLLKQLEITQERERNVFGELKVALMDSSLPMKSRVSGPLFDSVNGAADDKF